MLIQVWRSAQACTERRFQEGILLQSGRWWTLSSHLFHLRTRILVSEKNHIQNSDHTHMCCHGNRYGSTLILACELSAGNVVTVFFAVIIGSFSLGNALPELETFATALGSATVVFEVIDRVRKLLQVFVCTVVTMGFP